MVGKFCASILMFICATTAFSAEDWLIATKNEVFDTSGKLSINVIKPNTVKGWPKQLKVNVSQAKRIERVMLTLTQPSDGNELRQRYSGIVKSDFTGNIVVSLTEKPSNRLMLVKNTSVDESNIAAVDQQDVEVAFANKEKQEEKNFKKIIVSDPEEDRTISANEPLYFIVGSSSERDFDARFQLSFKYRPFDPEARVSKFIPYASNLYFAYTQTSIWDLGSESSPFKDTSYRPSLYYNWNESGKGYNPDSWKFGFEHESNGRDGDESRSLNIAFVQPIWNIEYSGGKTFTFMPKFYHYLEKTDNRDLHHYRGYVDWIARYGRDDAAILTAMYRQGTDGYAQGQLDLSYPISDKLFGRTGTFLHFQLLGGYGETLIDYNKRSDTQLRVGISIAR